MKRSLRQVLADSHIAAVTIVVLLLWSLDDAFRALWDPFFRAISFLSTAVAIFDIPSFSRTFTTADRLSLITVGAYLYWALVTFFAAWILSRWVYGMGPLRSLTSRCTNSNRREHV